MARRGPRGKHQVGHAVGEAEQNFIWRELNGIFRPVKTDRFAAAEAAAAQQGRHLPDPRAGLPAHRTSHPRLTRQHQSELAGELGYVEIPKADYPRGAKATIFHNPDGEPPYIGYDIDGHGSRDRLGGTDTSTVQWKGAGSASDLTKTRRDGTYVPEFAPDGSVGFVRKKR